MSWGKSVGVWAAVAVAIFVAGSAQADLIYPTADAYVVNSDPDGNYGTLDHDSTWFWYNSAWRGRSYLKFSLAGLPDRSAITSATLSLYLYDGGGYTNGTRICHVTDDTWTETGITWNNQPLLVPVPGDTLIYQIVPFTPGWVNFDLLSSGVWDYDADRSDGVVSLLMMGDEGGDEAHNFYSKEETQVGDYRPRLQITVVPEPASGVWVGLGVGGLLLRWRSRRA